MLVAPKWPGRTWYVPLCRACTDTFPEGSAPKPAKWTGLQRVTTRKLYDFLLLVSFCKGQGFCADTASLPQIVDYLVHLRITRALKASSINTNLAGIMSVIRKWSPGLDVSVLKELIESFRQADGRRKPREPEWDLSTVLNHLKSDFL